MSKGNLKGNLKRKFKRTFKKEIKEQREKGLLHSLPDQRRDNPIDILVGDITKGNVMSFFGDMKEHSEGYYYTDQEQNDHATVVIIIKKENHHCPSVIVVTLPVLVIFLGCCLRSQLQTINGTVSVINIIS